jgi:hypothetical protein
MANLLYFDGTEYVEVPEEEAEQAEAAGLKRQVLMLSPEGEHISVPIEESTEAMKSGLTLPGVEVPTPAAPQEDPLYAGPLGQLNKAVGTVTKPLAAGYTMGATTGLDYLSKRASGKSAEESQYKPTGVETAAEVTGSLLSPVSLGGAILKGLGSLSKNSAIAGKVAKLVQDSAFLRTLTAGGKGSFQAATDAGTQAIMEGKDTEQVKDTMSTAAKFGGGLGLAGKALQETGGYLKSLKTAQETPNIAPSAPELPKPAVTQSKLGKAERELRDSEKQISRLDKKIQSNKNAMEMSDALQQDVLTRQQNTLGREKRALERKQIIQQYKRDKYSVEDDVKLDKIKSAEEERDLLREQMELLQAPRQPQEKIELFTQRAIDADNKAQKLSQQIQDIKDGSFIDKPMSLELAPNYKLAIDKQAEHLDKLASEASGDKMGAATIVAAKYKNNSRYIDYQKRLLEAGEGISDPLARKNAIAEEAQNIQQELDTISSNLQEDTMGTLSDLGNLPKDWMSWAQKATKKDVKDIPDKLVQAHNNDVQAMQTVINDIVNGKQTDIILPKLTQKESNYLKNWLGTTREQVPVDMKSWEDKVNLYKARSDDYLQTSLELAKKPEATFLRLIDQTSSKLKKAEDRLNQSYKSIETADASRKLTDIRASGEIPVVPEIPGKAREIRTKQLGEEISGLKQERGSLEQKLADTKGIVSSLQKDLDLHSKAWKDYETEFAKYLETKNLPKQDQEKVSDILKQLVPRKVGLAAKLAGYGMEPVGSFAQNPGLLRQTALLWEQFKQDKQDKQRKQGNK